VVRKAVGFGSKPFKAPKPVAPRNYGFEQLLCQAIRRRVLVEMRYERDGADRTIAPYVVFESEPNDICLSCFQISNPAKPQDGDEPRNFTVGKIAALRLTEATFAIDPRFNRADAKYRHGVLCSV